MMNFGKGLVFVNLVFSFLFLGWAWGIYTQRIQYQTVTGRENEKVLGKVDELRERIDKLVRQRDAAESRWQTAHVAIVKAEDLRYQYLDWYAELRKILQEGTDKDGAPTKVLPLEEQNGQLIVDKQGLKPIKIGKEDAEGLRIYEDRYEQKKKEIVAEIEAINKLIKDQEALSEEINGKAGKIGLRGLLAQEELALKQSKEEQERMTPLLYNSQAEAELLVKRNLALKARLKELGGVVAADQ